MRTIYTSFNAACSCRKPHIRELLAIAISMFPLLYASASEYTKTKSLAEQQFYINSIATRSEKHRACHVDLNGNPETCDFTITEGETKWECNGNSNPYTVPAAEYDWEFNEATSANEDKMTNGLPKITFHPTSISHRPIYVSCTVKAGPAPDDTEDNEEVKVDWVDHGNVKLALWTFKVGVAYYVACDEGDPDMSIVYEDTPPEQNRGKVIHDGPLAYDTGIVSGDKQYVVEPDPAVAHPEENRLRWDCMIESGGNKYGIGSGNAGNIRGRIKTFLYTIARGKGTDVLELRAMAGGTVEAWNERLFLTIAEILARVATKNAKGWVKTVSKWAAENINRNPPHGAFSGAYLSGISYIDEIDGLLTPASKPPNLIYTEVRPGHGTFRDRINLNTLGSRGFVTQGYTQDPIKGCLVVQASCFAYGGTNTYWGWGRPRGRARAYIVAFPAGTGRDPWLRLLFGVYSGERGPRYIPSNQ